MKLSEISGERALDVIADIVEPVGVLVEDKKFIELAQTSGTGKTSALVKLIPYLLREHGNEIYQIIAATEGVSVEQYKKTHNLATIVKDVYDIITDEELLGFLTLSEQTKAAE